MAAWVLLYMRREGVVNAPNTLTTTTLARLARTRAPALQKTWAAPLTPDERRRAHVHGQPLAPAWGDAHAGPGPPRAPEPAIEEGPLGRPALARHGGLEDGTGSTITDPHKSLKSHV